MAKLAKRIAAFDVCTREICGHDPKALAAIASNCGNGPQFILLNTIKGNGISFMENRLEWHYLPLNEQQYKQAVDELEAA